MNINRKTVLSTKKRAQAKKDILINIFINFNHEFFNKNLSQVLKYLFNIFC